MNPMILRMFDHAHWANIRILNALKGANPLPDKPLSLFAHVLAAEQVWLGRLREEIGDTPFQIWPNLELTDCERLAHENHQGYQAYLSHCDLQRAVSYRNSQGTSFTTSVSDILTHVALHGSYHRGQVASLIRVEGYAPPSTDFIHFVRLGELH